jgi:uncharacterized protein (TIGR02145 family)
MKKIFLLSLVFFGFLNANGQIQVTLTFTGQDSLTQSFLPLDSVGVYNLTENCDTMLYGSVPLLSLSTYWPVGAGEIRIPESEAFVLKQNYPNPFDGSTSLIIEKARPGSLTVALFTTTGIKLAEYQRDLEKGFHVFDISSSESSMLILMAFDDLTCKSIKIFPSGQNRAANKINYSGRILNIGTGSFKSDGNSVFTFFLGNQMMYSAYASGYHDQSKFDHPVTSMAYTFDMVPLVIVVPPVVSTNIITNIMQTTATGGGNVTSDGGAAVSAKGICWSTSPGPTIANTYTTDGSGMGPYVSNLFGLTVNTQYYVRAYATNSVGTTYGNELTFTTLPLIDCGSPITDVRDGKVYNTVLIGSQCWMAQNLNVGAMIAFSVNQTDNGIIEKYCYQNLQTNCDLYGGFYHWNEFMDYTMSSPSIPSGRQGICPAGWHIPSDAEWCQMEVFIDPTVNCEVYGGRGVDAGGKLKEAGTIHWSSPNTGATNASGFTALPAGEVLAGGGFYYLTYWTDYWTSTENSATHAWTRYLNFNSIFAYRYEQVKGNGYSGRCLKN